MLNDMLNNGKIKIDKKVINKIDNYKLFGV